MIIRSPWSWIVIAPYATSLTIGVVLAVATAVKEYRDHPFRAAWFGHALFKLWLRSPAGRRRDQAWDDVIARWTPQHEWATNEWQEREEARRNIHRPIFLRFRRLNKTCPTWVLYPDSTMTGLGDRARNTSLWRGWL